MSSTFQISRTELNFNSVVNSDFHGDAYNKATARIHDHEGLVVILLTQIEQLKSLLFYLVYIEITNNYAQTNQ